MPSLLEICEKIGLEDPKHLSEFKSSIKSAVLEDNELSIKGPIVDESTRQWLDDEGYSSTSAESFKSRLSEMSGDIMIRISSGGGYVDEASEIVQALREYDGKVSAMVDGMAGSAASVVPMVAERVGIAEMGSVFVHLPWSMTVGNRIDHEASIEELNEAELAMKKLYSLRMKEDDIEAMVADNSGRGRTFGAEKAVELGFADYIAKDTDKKTETSSALAGHRRSPVMGSETETTELTPAEEITSIVDSVTAMSPDKESAVKAIASDSIAMGETVEEFRARYKSITVADKPNSRAIEKLGRDPKRFDINALAAHMARPLDREVQAYAAPEIKFTEEDNGIERLPAQGKNFINENSKVVPLAKLVEANIPANVRADVPDSDNGFNPTRTDQTRFLPLLFEQNGIVARCDVVTGLRGDYDLPQISDIGDMTYDNTKAATEANANNNVAVQTGEVSLTPRQISGHVFASFLSLRNSTQLERALRGVIRMKYNDTGDKGIILGTGEDGQPEGIIAADGTNKVSRNGALKFTSNDIREARQKVSEANALSGGALFVFRPDLYTLADGLPKTDGVSDLMTNAVISGYPVIESNYFEADAVNKTAGIFGNFFNVLVGVWSDTVIRRDDVSMDSRVGFRFVGWMDSALKYPEGFTEIARGAS